MWCVCDSFQAIHNSLTNFPAFPLTRHVKLRLGVFQRRGMSDGEHFEAELGFAGLGWPQGEAHAGGYIYI